MFVSQESDAGGCSFAKRDKRCRGSEVEKTEIECGMREAPVGVDIDKQLKCHSDEGQKRRVEAIIAAVISLLLFGIGFVFAF